MNGSSVPLLPDVTKIDGRRYLTRVIPQTSFTHRPQKVPRHQDMASRKQARTNSFSLHTHHNHNHGTQGNPNGPNRQTHRRRRPSIAFAASRSRTRFQRCKVDGFLQGEQLLPPTEFVQERACNTDANTRNSTLAPQTTSPAPPSPPA
jgi:hypothetical protein